MTGAGIGEVLVSARSFHEVRRDVRPHRRRPGRAGAGLPRRRGRLHRDRAGPRARRHRGGPRLRRRAGRRWPPWPSARPTRRGGATPTCSRTPRTTSGPPSPTRRSTWSSGSPRSRPSPRASPPARSATSRALSRTCPSPTPPSTWRCARTCCSPTPTASTPPGTWPRSLELARVATEVRVFPLVSHLDGRRYARLDRLRDDLAARGVASQVRRVGYELQRGGDEMLVLGGGAS